jgi:hypothetical protein
MAHDADYIKGGLVLALGEPLERAMPYLAKRWHKHAACLAMLPRKAGTITAINGLDNARQYARVEMRYRVGDTVPDLVDCTQRLGFVIAVGSTHAEANASAERALRCIEVVIE